MFEIKKLLSNQKHLSVFFGLIIGVALVAISLITIRVHAAAIVSGRVFQDFNGNGAYDTTVTSGAAIDRGVGGVTVTAYDSGGISRGATTTGSDGTYSINITGTGPYRIEFTTIPTGYYPSARSTDSVLGGNSTNSGTTIQFINNGGTTSNVNLAVSKPDDYCQNNPLLATTTFFGTVSGWTADPVITSFPYTSGTTSTTDSTGVDNPLTHALAIPHNVVGSVLGLVYHRRSQRLFAAAFTKRHAGFATNNANATGDIYIMNNSGSSASLFLNLNTLFGSNVAGSNPHDTADYFNDTTAFDAVGKTSFGDIELSEDERTLYAMNLNDRKLYAIPLGPGTPTAPTSSSQVVRYDLATLMNPGTGATGCPNDPATPAGELNRNLRPGGLKTKNGRVYVGMVCTAQSTNVTTDLRAFVYELNPLAVTATQVANFPLNYTRGFVSRNGGCTGSPPPTTCSPAAWRPWIANIASLLDGPFGQKFYPQPWILDIEFDENNFMMLGFGDRVEHQTGNDNGGANTGPIEGASAGDTLRLRQTGPTWTLESNASDGVNTTTGAGTNQGPGGGEFYIHDRYQVAGGTHDEITLGNLTYVPGFGEIVSSCFDPAPTGTLSGQNTFRAGGLVYLNNTTGLRARSYQLFGIDTPNTFGKAAGIGDIEAMCNLAPIEIGNYVWRDQDNDGIQDPGEQGINGVTVRLYRPGFGPDGIAGNADDNTALATAVTDNNNNGEYYFISGTGDGNTGNNVGILNGNILPNTYYDIRLDNNANFQSGGPLNGLSLTPPNVTSQAGDKDATDSDAAYEPNTACANNGNFCPTISFSTGDKGANTHRLDFGLDDGTVYTNGATYSLGNRVWYDTDNNGSLGGSEVGIANVQVSLFVDADNNGAPDDLNAPLQTLWTSSTGYYRFDGLGQGNYIVRVDPRNFSKGEVLDGYRNTGPTEADPDSAVDSNDNGLNPASANNPQSSAVGILSGTITLGPGTAEPTGESDLGTLGQGIADNRADMTLDFGFYRLSLNGTVWNDSFNNGLLGVGETRVSNVRVRLFDSAGTSEIPVGPDGVLGTADDANGGVFTDANGDYAFSGLAAGDYVVKVTPTGGTSSNATGYEPGPDPDNDADSDDNGTNGTGANAGLLVGAPITLTPGSEPTVTNATGASSNPTYDFGINFAPTVVKLVSFDAYQEGDQVLLRWESGFEVDNLGYNVICESNGRQETVTPSLVAGSALQVGTGTVLMAGNSYVWKDKLSAEEIASGGARYWLEAVDVNGERELYGPVVPQAGIPRGTQLSRSQTLSEVGRDRAQAQREWPTASETKTTKSKIKSTANQQAQSSIARNEAVKITVRRDGWYRVSYEQLASAGFNRSSDSSQWKLFTNGEEQAMRVNEDGSIEFYGQSLDTRSTDERVYWLVAGQSKGRRVEANKVTAFDEGAATTFTQTVERRDKVIRFAGLMNGAADNFFGPVINNNAVNQTLVVNKLNQQAGGSAVLEVGVQGLTWDSHNIVVHLNGVEVGTITSAGRAHPVLRMDVDLQNAREGENVVSLVSTNGSSDVSLVDFVRLSYPRRAEAINNRLLFGAESGQQTRIAGFTTERVRILDLTNPSAVSELIVEGQLDQAGQYAFNLPPMNGARKLLAFAVGQEDNVTGVSANAPSSLNSEKNGADFIIVTHKNFRQAIEPLRELRESQGLKTKVVDIEDVYDEFNFGARDVEGLKRFLQHALTRWQLKPRYVMFVGDASYDPRNYLGGGGPSADLVPTEMIDTDYLETASDESLADFNNDGIAEASMGRLPARSVEEASLVVNKIIAYERELKGKPTGRGGVFVSDGPNGYDFEGGSQQIRSLMPDGMPVEVINRADGDVTTVRSRINTALNAGPAIVNYMGHGSVATWTNAGIMTGADATNLQNGSRLPVAVLMTCLNGSFGESGIDSFAESLLKAPNGGAVAAWASSGLTFPSSQLPMNARFYQALFSNDAVTVGDAAREAKQATVDQNVRRTWIFFGDPTMRLR
jgi:hypothetical protein